MQTLGKNSLQPFSKSESPLCIVFQRLRISEHQDQLLEDFELYQPDLQSILWREHDPHFLGTNFRPRRLGDTVRHRLGILRI